VDAGNSLIGSAPNGHVGSAVTFLSNGNYVVDSPSWNGNRGAATWGDGTSGVSGPVDASNSLIGSDPNDGVGSAVTPLSNGNYVIRSPSWNGGRGAVTWGSGTDGISGPVDASNSLVGSFPGDRVGADIVTERFRVNGITVLSNGNYVIRSPNWNGGRGAVTWGSGTGGGTGPVVATNSLVGS
jgi:hypothetical protein